MKSVGDLGVSSGKWYVGAEEYDGGCIVYSGFGGRIIARANHYIKEAKANARLIGCAKEMYTLLREAGQYIQYCDSKLANRIAKVLEKAGGAE